MIIRVDGGEPIDFAKFIELNDFGVDEHMRMFDALSTTGQYEGGGGAAAKFTLTLADEPSDEPNDERKYKPGDEVKFG